MFKDSKTDDFGNYNFSQKNQNSEWKTTLATILYKLTPHICDSGRRNCSASMIWREISFRLAGVSLMPKAWELVGMFWGRSA